MGLPRTVEGLEIFRGKRLQGIKGRLRFYLFLLQALGGCSAIVSAWRFRALSFQMSLTPSTILKPFIETIKHLVGCLEPQSLPLSSIQSLMISTK